MINKKLLIVPTDLSQLIDGNKVILNRLCNVAIANVTTSIPLVNDAIVPEGHHVSTEVELEKTFNKNDMVSNAKNVLIDIGYREEDISNLILAVEDNSNNATTIESRLLEYLNNNNNLIYLASAGSLLTNNTVDIYYHKVDKCIYIAPELSSLGSPIVFDGINFEIDIYRVAPLEFKESALSSITFDPETTRYYPDMKFKDSAVDNSITLATARADINIHLVVLEGLNHYAMKQEYARYTGKSGSNQANNVQTDHLIHILVLDIDAAELLEDNLNVRQGVIMQASPFQWRMKHTGKTRIGKLTFPLYF